VDCRAGPGSEREFLWLGMIGMEHALFVALFSLIDRGLVYQVAVGKDGGGFCLPPSRSACWR